MKGVFAEADDPEASEREKRAREAAALDDQRRVEAAIGTVRDLQFEGKLAPRASTTDADARLAELAPLDAALFPHAVVRAAITLAAASTVMRWASIARSYRGSRPYGADAMATALSPDPPTATGLDHELPMRRAWYATPLEM